MVPAHQRSNRLCSTSNRPLNRRIERRQAQVDAVLIKRAQSVQKHIQIAGVIVAFHESNIDRFRQGTLEDGRKEGVWRQLNNDGIFGQTLTAIVEQYWRE